MPVIKKSQRRLTSGLAIETVDDATVLAIHEQLTAEFSTTEDPISPPGVRDLGLLASAVSRQHTAVGSVMKYQTPPSNAAALMFGLCNNHPFFNGNKRAALVAGLLHLDRNHLVLEGVDKEDLFRLMKRIASHHFSARRQGKDVLSDPDEEIKSVAAWLEQNSREIKRGERSIPYSEFYRIIEQFGFRMGAKKNNQVEILQLKKNWLGREKWVCIHKVPCPGDSRIVQLAEIKAARRILNLTEQDGVDSQSFYDTRLVIDTFITSHRQLLRKLART